jgi:hypothetical protein
MECPLLSAAAEGRALKQLRTSSMGPRMMPGQMAAAAAAAAATHVVSRSLLLICMRMLCRCVVLA